MPFSVHVGHASAELTKAFGSGVPPMMPGVGFGAGIERMCELALTWLDVAGVFKTAPEERRIELNWPSPLPENEMEKLDEAEAKLRIGVDRAVVLRELGY